jgi:hypothetical protein
VPSRIAPTSFACRWSTAMSRVRPAGSGLGCGVLRAECSGGSPGFDWYGRPLRNPSGAARVRVRVSCKVHGLTDWNGLEWTYGRGMDRKGLGMGWKIRG